MQCVYGCFIKKEKKEKEKEKEKEKKKEITQKLSV